MIDYNKVLCPAIKEMKPSGIRKFFDIAQQLEGVISLGVGEPDFKTPWLIRQEAISTLEKGKTCYTANALVIAAFPAVFVIHILGVFLCRGSRIVIFISG